MQRNQKLSPDALGEADAKARMLRCNVPLTCYGAMQWGPQPSPDALGEAGAEAQLEVVDRDVVEHRVGACQVDVLEDARPQLQATCIEFSVMTAQPDCQDSRDEYAFYRSTSLSRNLIFWQDVMVSHPQEPKS